MNRHRLPTALALVVLLGMRFPLLLPAQDAENPLTSGPPADTPLGSVSCYANSGPYSGRESFDVAGEIGEDPGALLFIHVLDRNTAPVLRGVDKLGTELGLFGFKAFVIMLKGDRTEGEEQMKRVNGSLKLKNPMVLSLDGLEGPGDLALNRRCTLSLVVANGGKVTESIGFTDTGLHDMKRIRAAFERAVGGVPKSPEALLAAAMARLPKDEAALRELAAKQAVELYRARQKATEDYAASRRYPARGGGGANMRGKGTARGDAPKRGAGDASPDKKAGADPTRVRRGGPPDDGQLNSLLRSFIRRDNADERNDEVFADIKKRSEESGDLDKQAIAMFQLMLSYPDRYGSEHAQKLAKQFLTERGKE